MKDMLFGLKKTFPDRPEYRHMEGNTTSPPEGPAFMGSSATVLIEKRRPGAGHLAGNLLL
mgnify:CR=1 FL=1